MISLLEACDLRFIKAKQPSLALEYAYTLIHFWAPLILLLAYIIEPQNKNMPT